VVGAERAHHLEHVRMMGEAANHVTLAASGQSQSIEGTICITASEVISAFLLPPILARLRRTHPGVEIKLVTSNAIHDLRRREADIAIRSGRPTDPNLIATRLRDTPARLYATPAYLKQLGNPAKAADLARADFIGFGEDDRFLHGLNALGFDLTPRNFPIQVANHMVLWELVKSGLGIGAIIDEVGDAEAPAIWMQCSWSRSRRWDATSAGARERSRRPPRNSASRRSIRPRPRRYRRQRAAVQGEVGKARATGTSCSLIRMKLPRALAALTKPGSLQRPPPIQEAGFDRHPLRCVDVQTLGNERPVRAVRRLPER
jgi:DNA-binding transcriptional LysR family regulator